jgi:hypothetical protein
MKKMVLCWVLAFVFGCGGEVVLVPEHDGAVGSGAGGYDDTATATTGTTSTTTTTSTGVGGSGGEGGQGGSGGGPECVTDEDCAVHNTECYVFVCQVDACYGHERDDDEDGYSSCGGELPGSYDCADQDPSIHPDAPETCNDGVDSNCDGTDNDGCAIYCNPWMNGQVFGYNGCCGTYQTEAAPITHGTLFKAEGDVFDHVYYMGSNGKRYVFPTTTVLDSWYGDLDMDGVPLVTISLCETVHQYTLDEVAAVWIGGNVTIRPGTYVTGIDSDPKRWLIGPGGVLRELAPESVGDLIYPGNYAARVHLTPDPFFVNYVTGAPVSDPAEYDLAAALARTLEQELGITP